MTRALTIDRAGRIVLPVELRRRLNLVPGSRLQLEVVAQRIELTPEPVPVADLAVSGGGRTVLRATGGKLDAAGAVRAERELQAGRSGRR